MEPAGPARDPGGDRAAAAAAPPELQRRPPDPLPVGGGTALFVEGLLGDLDPDSELWLTADGARLPLMGAGMPPPRSRAGEGYWWAVVPVPRREREDRLVLELHSRDGDEGERVSALSETALAQSYPVPPQREQA